MKLEKSPNNNLIIISEPEDADMLATLKDKHEGDDKAFLHDLLEETGWCGNGKLMAINPEDIGALTEAPIVTDGRDIEEDGTVTVHGNVWWFPNYMVENFAETLIEKGRVTFKFAPSDSEQNAVKETASSPRA